MKVLLSADKNDTVDLTENMKTKLENNLLMNVLTEVLQKALVKRTDNDHENITVTVYDTAELSTLIKIYSNTDVF